MPDEAEQRALADIPAGDQRGEDEEPGTEEEEGGRRPGDDEAGGETADEADGGESAGDWSAGDGSAHATKSLDAGGNPRGSGVSRRRNPWSSRA
jgi:hypothetical protein